MAIFNSKLLGKPGKHIWHEPFGDRWIDIRFIASAESRIWDVAAGSGLG